MLSEVKIGPIPQMPFEEMCELLAEAMKSIPSERVIKTFKQTLFSLPVDGSKDQTEGSKSLLDFIAKAPSFDELSPDERSKVTQKKFSKISIVM